MMTQSQMDKIRGYQREYESLYGEKLHIDWPCMKGVSKRVYFRKYAPDIPMVDPEKILNQCIIKYNANLQTIKDRTTRIHMHGNTKERLAVIEYSKEVLSNRCNVQEAANLINRNRSLLYYYASM